MFDEKEGNAATQFKNDNFTTTEKWNGLSQQDMLGQRQNSYWAGVLSKDLNVYYETRLCHPQSLF